MSTKAVSSVNSVSGGERRILKGSPATAAVPAASSSTDATVNPDALLEAWENHGAVAHGLRADGRLSIPTQTSDPAVLHDNDFWVGLNAGVPELRYRRGGATVVLGGPGGGSGPSSSGLSLPCLTDGLKKGVAVRTLLSTGMKCDVATCGLNSVSTQAYRAIGLLNADVSGVTPVEILISGMRIDLTGPQINHLIGGSAGVLVPSQRYYLSASGRWTTRPDLESGAEVAMGLGIALTTTSLQILIGPVVIL